MTLTREEAHMSEAEFCQKLSDGTYSVGFYIENYDGMWPFDEWIETASGPTRHAALKDRLRYWEEYERE